MPDLDAFEALVKQKIKLLAAKDAKTRRKAAEWLGEAGDPTAITFLAQAYKNDSDMEVREKASYALGMFRKLETELDGPNGEKVVKLLQDIALKGKMGGRPRIATRNMVKIELGLLLSAILVAVLSFVLPSVLPNDLIPSNPGQNVTQQQPTSQPASDKDRTILLSEIRQTWVSLAGDGGALLTQFQAAQSSTPLNCATSLTHPAAYNLSSNNRSEYGDIGELVDMVNNAQSVLSSADSAFTQACNSGGTISAEAAGQQATALQTVMNAIPEIGQKLAAAESQSAQQATSAPTETVVSQPTAESATTLNIRTDLLSLQTIIDNMTAPDGPNSKLDVYWKESQGPAGTAGCNNQVLASAIPPDYVLSADGQAVPDLVLAGGLVNTGLSAVRQGRDLFASACPTPVTFAERGLTFSVSATTAFTNAANIQANLRATQK
jgi:HEAT repeat protein